MNLMMSFLRTSHLDFLQSKCEGHEFKIDLEDEVPPVHLATEISATRLDKMLKRKEVERAFLGITRLVKEDLEGMETPEESMTIQKPKWDQALPSHICVVLEEFDDVFPQDLPLGLPPVR